MIDQIKYAILLFSLCALFFIAHGLIFAPEGGSIRDGLYHYPFMALIYVVISGVLTERLGRKWWHDKKPDQQ